MPSPSAATTLEALQHGEITVKGRFLWGSNYTFLADVELDGLKVQSVYKPTQGERPLWDFPTASLAHRETAAYLVSQALGWGMVPETVYRSDAPAGPGSIQLYIEHDPELHYFNFEDEEIQRLRPVAALDVLINNADRKGGHILMDEEHQIWLIDHGLCFHREDKLRTVVWNFASEPVPEPLLEEVRAFRLLLAPGCDFFAELSNHLSQVEIRALQRRTDKLLERCEFPEPREDRRAYPWPPI